MIKQILSLFKPEKSPAGLFALKPPFLAQNRGFKPKNCMNLPNIWILLSNMAKYGKI